MSYDQDAYALVLVAAAAVATLAFANAALAANTASFSVWHTPMVLADSQSTTIHFSVPQSTDGIAAVNIYVRAATAPHTARRPAPRSATSMRRRSRTTAG